MDPRKLSFLQAIVGPDGASALAKAAALGPDIEWAILPRAIIAWIGAVSNAPYDADLPGVPEIKLRLSKNEDAYDGHITLGADLYTFRDVGLDHVAGSVAVALGADADQAPVFQSSALAKLGKSIDLLVKSRTLRKIAKPKGGAAGGKGIKLPGMAAMPIAPIAPIPPDPTAPEPTGPAAGTRTAGAPAKEGDVHAGGTAKPATGTKPVPGVKPKKPSLKVTKAEAERLCPVCEQRQFVNDRYRACYCFSDLQKSVRTTTVADGYVLEFGSAWDSDAILSLIENLGK
jgi:hypothetical protein